jgi:hypothetical protein
MPIAMYAPPPLPQVDGELFTVGRPAPGSYTVASWNDTASSKDVATVQQMINEYYVEGCTCRFYDAGDDNGEGEPYFSFRVDRLCKVHGITPEQDREFARIQAERRSDPACACTISREEVYSNGHLAISWIAFDCPVHRPPERRQVVRATAAKCSERPVDYDDDLPW